MLGLVGEKIGMIQIYGQDGAMVPVTVIRVQPNVVTAIRTVKANGYSGIQVGFGEKKESRVNKPQRAYFKKHNLKAFGFLTEFRIDSAESFQLGAEFKAACLKVGEVIDVQGRSKGKGFQGVMRRWNFAGGRDTHGCSLSHRVPGSIGQRAYPGRVFPGKKMPGHMGDETVTTKNLTIVGVEAEQNLVLIRGAVPGAKNSKVFLYPQAKDFSERVLKQSQPQDQKTA